MTYNVVVIRSQAIDVEVEADSEELARDIALNQADFDGVDDFEYYVQEVSNGSDD